MICVACESSLPPASGPCLECGQDPLLDGRFQLEDILGSGATGVVYRAVELATGRPVAIKTTPISRDSSDQLTRLVEREARVLRQLDHPGIPAYLDQVIAGRGRARSLYLVQELVTGQTLAEELEGHRYSEDEVLGIVAELADILEAAEDGVDLPGSVTADGRVIAGEQVPPGGKM